ncbi:Zinc finger BED domain-containing protein 4 [Labeo rohita]|uniref:Zinc finger BED domain-containing protein 4 n=3 Tax=Labeo rohita TaxID=84645 RepID=A0ABQ8MKL3_LABRO|nr:E3 SUMO-protein ligase ZBED1 isoform X1 [Labeo rohita]XP_050969299.1 E3 SUMO-protein ligase ZBED1 isoform X1 [Labeo rohita]KAI2663399.1 Zinc finger BED domain-containing protein 4 [Labeo rohita]
MERSRSAFDHWMHKHHFTFRDTRGRNITVQCNLCLPKINILSTARDSTSNLKKHLECHSPSQMRKRQHTEMSEPEPLFLPPKRLKSAVWEYFGYLKDPGGTIIVDGYPVCRLCRKKVSARASNTSNMAHHLRDHHPKEFAKMNRKHSVVCRRRIRDVPSSDAPSSDGPSNYGPSSYGPSIVENQTAESSEAKEAKIDPTIYHQTTQSRLNTLVFNFIVEDVQPISILEQPGFRRLIEALSRGKKVMSRNAFISRLEVAFDKMKGELKAKLDKVQTLCTTADVWSVQDRSYFGMTCHWLEDNLERKSAALACTRIPISYTCESIIAKIQEIHSSYNIESKVQATVTDNGNNFIKAFKEFASDDDQEVEQSHFEDLGSILCDGEIGGDFFLSYFLPPHQRCASQTLNLIASKDLADAVSKGPAGKLHSSAAEKCAAIWHKTQSSTEAADAMESIAKMKFTVPCLNQWSSEYYAINKIMSLTDTQLNELTEVLGVPHFTPDETAYLTEYTDVFKPVAFALDLLHGEEKCFLGIVIPTLLTLKRKLEEKAANTRLFSRVIESTVKAIDSRFKQVFESSDARLATATMPQFRLWWLPEDERESLRAQLITEVLQVDQGTEETETNGGSVHEDEFFSYGPGSSGNKSGKREAAEEVWLYLQGTNKDLKCLHEFPGVKKVFIKFNTTLPSSAPVQQLFSNGSNIVTPKGHHLSDEHFERVLLLRYNSKITTALE